jgi:hypothetical protein
MLHEQTDFLDETIIIPRRNDTPYKTYTIKQGVKVFRGESAAGKIPSTQFPAFFSDIISASIYTRGVKENLNIYEVIKQPNLFHLSYENLISLFDNDKRLSEEERNALDNYVQVSDENPPYIIPVMFLKKENAAGEFPLYLNRRIINLICRLGYDGWVALPETLLQRNLDSAHYKKTGIMTFKLNFYSPEIALCKWDNFLKAV